MSKDFNNKEQDWHKQLSDKIASTPLKGLRKPIGRLPLSMQLGIRPTAGELARRMFSDTIPPDQIVVLMETLEKYGYTGKVVRSTNLNIPVTNKEESVMPVVVSNNLTAMSDNYISREAFCEIFGEVDSILWDRNFEHNGSSFKCFLHSDSCYMLHLESGTCISYYKHLGRANECSKPLSDAELILFRDLLLRELEGEILDPDDVISERDLECLVVKANSARFVDRNENDVTEYMEKLPIVRGKYDIINDSQPDSVYYYVCGISPDKNKVFEVAVDTSVAKRLTNGEIIVYDSNKLAEIIGLPPSLLTSDK